MAKKVLQISKYTGGLNSYSDPRDLKEDEFQVLDNASVDEEGIIRVSGAREVKNNIDIINNNPGDWNLLSKSGGGLFSYLTDYFISSSSINSNLSPSGQGGGAWGVTDVDADGTWSFGASPNKDLFDMVSAAINKITYVAASDATTGVHNHGSLTFKGITLLSGTSYRIVLHCVSENPWY